MSPRSCMSAKPCTCTASSTSDQAWRTSRRVSGPTVVKSSNPPSRSTRAASLNTARGSHQGRSRLAKTRSTLPSRSGRRSASPVMAAARSRGRHRARARAAMCRQRSQGENRRAGIDRGQFRARLARGGAHIEDSARIQLEQRQPLKQPRARFGVDRVGAVEGGACPPQPNQRGAAVGQSKRGLHRRANQSASCPWRKFRVAPAQRAGMHRRSIGLLRRGGVPPHAAGLLPREASSAPPVARASAPVS